MENRISKVFKLILSFFMLLSMIPMTTRTAYAETKELTFILMREIIKMNIGTVVLGKCYS